MFRQRAAWFAALGVLVSVIIATVVGISALRHPISFYRLDPFWVGLYLVTFLLIALLCWVWRGRLLIGLSAFAVLALVLATVVRAGTGPSLLLLLWLLLISMALGARALDLIAPSSQGTGLERSILAASIGFGAISLLIFGLGTAQLLYRLVVLGCLIALTAFVPGWARSWAGSLRTGFAGARARWETADLRLYSIGISTLALCGLAGYIWAIAPSIHYDALVYHLGVPAIYVQQHGLVKVPEQFSSYWAHNAEMLYTLGLLLVGQPLPALCHLLFGVLTAGLVFCMGRRLGGARLGLLGAVLFYSLPLVTWESGTAYIDLQVAFYSFATAYALMIWWQDGGEGWLIGVGLLAGLGLGTKLDAVLAVLPLILLLLAGLILRHGVSRRVLSGLLRFGVPALLLSAIWLLRDWVWTGNPIFPYLNTVFESRQWPLENPVFNMSTFGVGHGALFFLRLPWDLTVNASAFMEWAPLGLAGAVPLLAIPWSFPLHSGERRRMVAVLSAFALMGSALWFTLGQSVRYLLVIIPGLCLLGAWNIEALWLWLSKLRAWKVVLALLWMCTSAYLATTRLVDIEFNWQIPERYPYRFALGLQSAEEFLSQNFREYDAFQFLNQQGEGAHKVLSIGSQFRLYTTSRIFGVLGAPATEDEAFTLPPGLNLAQNLQRLGYGYILIDQSFVEYHPDWYQIPVMDKAWLAQNARLVFSRHDVFVYRLLAEGG
ncbi:MAG: glycosyltransferase family 39 protein [Anaerolineales bacterium]